ncbi:glycosyl hydrolase family 28-related protein [Paenibacillus kribbensis]|uniref:glycosyl hydrolase family 28-related protein n=1 Tax=Paenibacillus kribbensis TaxID=172713 RepID=UPI000837FD25|nr:glycosyl hydrolase family 28-related protein [Paenibacillus kribbensis]
MLSIFSRKVRLSLLLVAVIAFVIQGSTGDIHVAQAADNVINAKDFGVKTNSNTSQSKEIQNALKYFYDRGMEGTVYFPKGTYLVDESIRLYAGVSLNGDGIGKTIFKKTGSKNQYVIGNPILRNNSDRLDVKLSNLTIDADRTNREARGEGQVGGIIIDVAVSHLTLDRVEVRDTTIGALLRRTRDSEITNSRFDRNNGHAIATGHESFPAGEFRNVKITNNQITNSGGGSGINLSRATYTTVTGNQIINKTHQSDGYAGIRIPNNGANNTVYNNVIENYPRGIFVLTGATGNNVYKNTIKNASLQGLLVESDGNTFTDNEFFQTNSSLKPDAVIRLSSANNNKIISNEMTTYSGFSSIGIRVTNSNTNEIKDNITDTSGKSVSIEGGKNNVNTGNRNR